MKHIAPILACLLLASCTSTGERVEQSQEEVRKAILGVSSAQERLAQSAAESNTITRAALQKEVDPSPAVVLATKYADITESTLDSAGYNVPTAREQELQKLVENLLSENKELVKEGNRAQEKLIKQISAKQTELDRANILLEDTREEAAAQAKKAGEIADELSEFKEEMGSWFGLGAVAWGLKTLGWWAFGVVALAVIAFVVLGVFFPPVFGVIISILTWIVPNAAQAAGYVAKGTYDVAQSTVSKMATAIEEFKVVNRGAWEQDLKPRLSEKMDSEHKEIVNRSKP